MKIAYNISCTIDYVSFELIVRCRMRKSTDYYFSSKRDAEEFAAKLQALLEEVKDALEKNPNLTYEEQRKLVEGLISPELIPVIESFDVNQIEIRDEGEKPSSSYSNMRN